MKHITSFLTLALFSFLLVSCDTDSDTIDINGDLTAQIGIPIKNQVPNRAYDTEFNGIYHGIIASGETTSRGKIWINLGNNSLYSASIEMVNGDVYDFVLKNDYYQINTQTEVQFLGTAGKFTVNVSDINAPVVTEVVLNNQSYFSSVVKSRNMSEAISSTGIFEDPVNTSFTGTWNIISDGTIMGPNGYDGQAITSVVVTYNGVMYTETMMEDYYFDCTREEETIPTMEEHGEGSILAGSQVSEFGGRTVWSLGVFPAKPTGYINITDCFKDISSGWFMWGHRTNGLTRNGEIYIDPPL
ncbi:hypothetical protein [Ulvibacter litoralis]|nr:hypothetical protein [Ulvibacter litoralis]